jgi:hypothetical protein
LLELNMLCPEQLGQAIPSALQIRAAQWWRIQADPGKARATLTAVFTCFWFYQTAGLTPRRFFVVTLSRSL